MVNRNWKCLQLNKKFSRQKDFLSPVCSSWAVYFLFMCCRTVKCTTSYWKTCSYTEIDLVWTPALEYSLLSPRLLAGPPASSLRFSSSLAPRSRLCFHFGWASLPPRSPSDGCCSWTLLVLHQGRCPVAIGCQSSQCPGKTYSNHWKMALCKRKVTLRTRYRVGIQWIKSGLTQCRKEIQTKHLAFYEYFLFCDNKLVFWLFILFYKGYFGNGGISCDRNTVRWCNPDKIIGHGGCHVIRKRSWFITVQQWLCLTPSFTASILTIMCKSYQST